MKRIALIVFFLASFKAFSQDSSKSNLTAFFEKGFGYSFNADGPYNYYTSDYMLIGHPNFTHGVNLNIHYGILLNKSHTLGIATRFSGTFYYTSKRKVRHYYGNQVGGLEVNEFPFFYQSHLEISPLLTLTEKKATLDAELFIGHGSLTYPYLFVRTTEENNRQTNNANFLYIYRPSQSFSYSTLSPALTYRRNYQKSRYWFLRGEIEMNFPGSNSSISYQKIPVPIDYYGKRNMPAYAPEYFTSLMISGGIGTSIGK